MKNKDSILEDLGKLFSLTKDQLRVFTYLLDVYKTSQFKLSDLSKKSISESLGIAEYSFKNMLSVFIRKRLLYRIKRGVYYINPDINIHKFNNIRLMLSIRYDEKGRFMCVTGDFE